MNCAISPDLPFAHWRVVHTIFLANLFRRQPRSLLLTDGSLSRNGGNYVFGNVEFRWIEGFVFIVFGLGVVRFPVLLLFGTFWILFLFQFAYFLEQNVALFESFLGFGFKKVFLGKRLEFFVRHALFDEEFELVMLLITGNELFHEEQIRVQINAKKNYSKQMVNVGRFPLLWILLLLQWWRVTMLGQQPMLSGYGKVSHGNMQQLS